MNNVRRILMAVFGAILFLALAMVFYQRFSYDPEAGGRERGESVVAVEVTSVERDSIRNVRAFSGSLVSQSNFDIVAKAGGQLSALEVDIGDRVERGQVIGRIDDEPFVQDVVQAEAEREVARANLEEALSSLELAERERDRVQALRERRVVSAADLDAAEAAVQAERSRVRVTEALIQQREAALRAARLRLSYTEITANWEGPGDYRVVGERYVEEGSTLTGNQPVVSLVDLQRLRAVIQVTERDYGRIEVGQSGVILTDVLPDESFEAAVVRRSPQFRESSRQARVELDVPNPRELLMPGQFIRVRLELGRVEDAVVVPRDALVRRDGRQGIFLVESAGEEGKVTAVFVPVTPGYVEGGRVRIVAPEINGEVVVLGQDLLADGTPVRVVARRDAEDWRAGLVSVDDRLELR